MGFEYFRIFLRASEGYDDSHLVGNVLGGQKTEVVAQVVARVIAADTVTDGLHVEFGGQEAKPVAIGLAVGVVAVEQGDT